MRRYADPVEVRTLTGEEASAPAAFLWRGRLYVVRDVLGHWRERRSWWSSPAARMVHGEGAGPEDLPGDESGDVARDVAEDVARDVARPVVRVAELAEELQVWRVSASPGRSFPDGVYDLCKEPTGRTASRGSPDGLWRIVHVAD
jgi:Family of unknown function (DUF6504)